jgi:metal-sulfur cluster biosynthetic enzyme
MSGASGSDSDANVDPDADANVDPDADANVDLDADSRVDPERVRERLRGVVDPCSAATGSNLDIVEMGLVKSVEVDGGHVDVEMRLTSPMCHMVPYFIEEVEDGVGDLGGVEAVELETDHGFEWSEEMMSAEAKRKRQAVLDEHASRYQEDQAAEETVSDACY